MSRTPERLMTVRIKTGSHAGEFREVPHDVGMELVRSDRAEIAAFDDHRFDRMIGCFVTPRKQPEVDLTNHWYERLAAPLKADRIQAAEEQRKATARTRQLDLELRARKLPCREL